MGRSKTIYGCIIAMLVCTVLGVMVNVAEVWAVDTNNFYFSDFTADYYLSKDAEGISHLKVVENLTAEFPNFNQNKGISRQIPFTNQDGANITLKNLNQSNIKILRNGNPEPIWGISKKGDYFLVETGTDDYVLGTQKYTLEYEYERVVTDFSSYQELYWDANGNGWPQKFSSVTARLHFADESVWTGESWCYVGSYGESGQDKCTITEIADGVEFTTKNLDAYENLTFDVKLLPGSFVVPEPEKDYMIIIAAVAVIVGCAILLGYKIHKYQDIAKRIKEYKAIFVAPQYQPNPDCSLAEMAEIYLGKKKDVKVGILLDLIVKKKVELHKKGDEGIDIKHKWALLVKNTDIREEGMILLEILANKLIIKERDVIELESRTATNMLMELGKQFDRVVLDDVKQDDLVDSGYKIGNAKSLNGVSGLFSSLFAALMVMFGVFVFLVGFAGEILSSIHIGGNMVGGLPVVILMGAVVLLTLTAVFWMSERAKIIKNFTTKGMEASKYMEGLKLYIEMAEVERMKLLQSVEGADTSAEGIVKLYEKLLPYAAVFGLEESWMREMKEFCNAREVAEPDYLMNGITTMQLSRAMRSSAGYASSAGHTIAGGGSFSSSSSGGGGGGFSGGGGGGGGGGGR